MAAYSLALSRTTLRPANRFRRAAMLGDADVNGSLRPVKLRLGFKQIEAELITRAPGALPVAS
jgi:hypothetical protein